MSRPKAVLFDRDGTLFSVNGPTPHALNTWVDHGRSNAEWHDFNSSIRFDPLIPMVAALWHAIRPGIQRVMVSGRDGEFRVPMTDCNHKWGIVPDAFFMRTPGDRRQDSIVKEEILDTLILPRWDVVYVIDDRPQVVEMWRRRGFSVLQVVDPKILSLIGGPHDAYPPAS